MENTKETTQSFLISTAKDYDLSLDEIKKLYKLAIDENDFYKRLEELIEF